MKGIAKTTWVLIITVCLFLLQPLRAEARFVKGADEMPSEMLVQARHYASVGISAIPVRTDGSKAPAVLSWKPYQSRIADQSELIEMFPPGEDRGIAAVCGNVSGDLEVLDFDEPSMYMNFQGRLGEMPGGQALIDKLTVLVETPSGGHHVYYRCSDGVEGGQKLAQRLVTCPDGKSKIETSIETRGERNYVLAPGSPPACHPSGKPYKLLKGDLAQIPTITGAERKLLLETARRLNELSQKALLTREPRAGQGDRPGDHFNREMNWEDILTPHGWEVVGQNGGTTHWRRPDKDGDGLSATTNHEGSGLLYVFSTNAHPFEAGRSYSKFAAYALLNHGGDFKAAAAALAREQAGTDRAREKESPEVEAGGPLAPSDNSQAAARIIELILGSSVELFHDQFKKPHARIWIEDHYEIWSCRGIQFKRFISKIFWESERKAPSGDAITAALGVLESMACFDGDEIFLHNRVARHGESIYYDLADRAWRVVEISAHSRKLLENPPTLFRRYSHQCPQVDPCDGGNLDDILGFVNIRNESEKLLLKIYLVAALVPDIAHPMIVVHGPQGSAKTTLLRILRRLIDPSRTETLAMSTDLRELVQLLSHHWATFFDNISSVSDWISDALCRAVTGDGFSKRELYTDDEDVIYEFKRCVALNGINIAVYKADLLDRCILIGLESIPPDCRREEQKFWEEFEKARPFIFGAMVTALSRAMAIRPSIQLPQLPRMADFAAWGCAIAVAVGHTAEEFLSAFQANSEARNDEALTASTVAAAIIALVGDKGQFELSPSTLLKRLTEIAGDQQAKARDWPKAPHVLTRRIKEVIPNLAAIGIDVEIGGRTRESRKITIRKRTPNVADDTASPPPPPSRPLTSSDPAHRDTGDASDASSQTSGGRDTTSEPSPQVHPTPESPKGDESGCEVLPRSPSKPRQLKRMEAALNRLKKGKAKAQAAQEASKPELEKILARQEGQCDKQRGEEER